MGRARALNAGFDEKRNTSRVFPVPPSAIEEARRAAERHQRTQPDWLRWIMARSERRHVHDGSMKRNDGSLAACPFPGCGWNPLASALD